ncbi:hypothetical protein FHS95_003324 [Sphingomonas naasensis]|uniref:Uncharacterized protein n=1 Tax=Sphingomonas naasensis TaxID=1344951 RepID=A0A4S1WFQ1_9SPHN|nr:hypothetical protein [Sphingomonas naasensis]NIJ21621.1 hypothetical protein [Sphingomonas naasensis]TGX41443.1 hypothetical protein E5A74_12485 [Sphingomonas naasensis]
MSGKLEARARLAGARAVARATLRLGEAARAALPGLAVEAEAEAGAGRVVISGRGLWRRWLRDPVLRWPGGWLR